jgi:hypothetical protein
MVRQCAFEWEFLRFASATLGGTRLDAEFLVERHGTVNTPSNSDLQWDCRVDFRYFLSSSGE